MDRGTDVGILGGGISALAFAGAIEQPCTIFEQEAVLGGLCRSFATGGVVWDIGPHIVFSKNEQVLEALKATTPMHRSRRSNRIFYQGRFVKYPFENDLAALPEADRDWCLNEFLANPYENYPAANMLAFFYRTFGEGITRAYLEPYNRKIWKFEPGFMDTQMVERIPRPPREDVIASAGGVATEGYTHQLHFHYPDQGGTASIIAGLVARCGPRLTAHTRAPVDRVVVEPDGCFTVTAGERRETFSRLVSTMPLHALVPRLSPGPPPEVEAALRALRFNSIHITIVRVRRDTLGDNFAIMVPAPEISFHRLSKLDFLGPAYTAPGGSTLMAEITFRKGTGYDASPQEISRLVTDDLARTGFVAREDVLEVETRTFEHAYVIYDLDHRRNTDQVLAWLRHLGIRPLGRFGTFEYINMDAAVERALEAAGEFRRSLAGTGSSRPPGHGAAGAGLGR